ncbi:hypothetical protein NL676_007375 [Syzygium grande]|nr:hypothetical protein NL676_007375 [Syzygium grande]
MAEDNNRVETSSAQFLHIEVANQSREEVTDMSRQHVEEGRQTELTPVALSTNRRTIEETQNELVDYVVRRMIEVVRPLIINTYHECTQGQYGGSIVPTQLRTGAPSALGSPAIQFGIMMQTTFTIPPIRKLPRDETLPIEPSEGLLYASTDPNGGIARQLVIDENLQRGHQVAQIQGLPVI